MSTTRSRARACAAVLLGLATLVGVACAPQPTAPFYGITFNAPSVGYIGQTFTPTAKATSGLPVQLALDPTSTGCSFVDGIVSFESIGSCVINANEPGDATHLPSKQVQRTIRVYECPPLREGLWTGPQNMSAYVYVAGNVFYGTIDLSAFGAGVQPFQGTVECQRATMVFNGVSLAGTLSPDGSTLSSSYQGIAIVLHAPAA
ncbi:MAG: hypothetical protein IT195_01085 [Microthrixaceae bacterium]|nr:hypothetical protein [Microthrixaceae bacterium]